MSKQIKKEDIQQWETESKDKTDQASNRIQVLISLLEELKKHNALQAKDINDTRIKAFVAEKGLVRAAKVKEELERRILALEVKIEAMKVMDRRMRDMVTFLKSHVCNNKNAIYEFLKDYEDLL